MNRTYIILLVSITLFFVSCKKDTTFLITNDAVGSLTKATKTNELNTLYSGVNDSLVAQENSYVLYEKGGKKLMKLYIEEDDKEVIDHIQFFDDRFNTDKGISLNSTYKDIETAYTVERVANMIDFIIVSVKESEAYFVIDKKHLSSELRFSTSNTLEPLQVPGEAPIKRFMFAWPL